MEVVASVQSISTVQTKVHFGIRMFRKTIDSVPKNVFTKFLDELSVIRLRKKIACLDKSNSILEAGL